MRPSRRDVLKTLGAGGLAALACPACGRRRRPPAAEPPPFEPDEARDLRAAIERILPGALEAGVYEHIAYWAATRPLEAVRRDLRRGAVQLRRMADQRHGRGFADLQPAEQDAILGEMAEGKVAAKGLDARKFFVTLHEFTLEGYLADPRYGGNRGEAGWKLIGHTPCHWAPRPSSRAARRSG